MQAKKLTGYPSIDKPWLKYYSEEAINAPLPEGSLYDYMTACTQDRLDCTALSYFGKKITHREFRQRIATCAATLTAHGVKKGDIVSVCILTMLEALVLLYAINYTGAVCNFLVLNATEQEMRSKLALTESRLLFTVDLAAEKVLKAAKDTAVKEIVCVPLSASMPPIVAFGARLKNKTTIPAGLTKWKDFLRKGKGITPSAAAVGSHDLAVLEYTSGTTGESKGAMLSNQAINTVPFHYRNSSTVFEFHSGEKFLCIVPPFLSVGLVTALLMPLCLGFELFLEPDPAPERMAEKIIKYRPNHICGSPLHVNNMISYELMEKHAATLKRTELGVEPRLNYIDERMREYLCTKWTRDDWDIEITIYRDKTLPPTPEEVRASLEKVRVTQQNAAILAPILARREEDKKYDLLRYIHENWDKI